MARAPRDLWPRKRIIELDTLFFVASKVFWAVARPESWIVLLLFVAFVALLAGRARLGRGMVLATLLLTLGIGVLPLGEALLRPLEQRFPTEPEVRAPAGIIVLGGAELPGASARTGLVEVNESAERFLAGVALARLHPEARLIFTGGSGSLLDQSVRGADVAGRLFAEAGVPPGQVLLERASRNTAENAALTLDLLGPEVEGPWILVTSAFHMPRSVAVFCAAGWEGIVPWPVDFRATGSRLIGWDLAESLARLNTGVREWIGLLAYRVTGRTETLFSDGC
jgi:uncharacterized SAM-binding protein YcdF (DUF218 family)